MKTPMARPGRRSPRRTLAVRAVTYRRLAARGGQPVALARVMGAAPDTTELIVADHKRIRRLLGKDDDDAGHGEDPGRPGAQPGVVPMRRLACRDAPGPMDGGVLADMLVLADAQTQALPGPGPAGSEPQRLSDQPAGYRLKFTRHRADQRPARNDPARCADADTGYAVGHRRAAADGPPLP